MTAWLVLGALAAIQGEAVMISLPDDSAAVAAQLTWQEQTIPMARRDGGWVALIGIDLDVEPGEYELPVHIELNDGRRRTHTETLGVGPGQYPETHLEVAQRYVDLNPEDQERAARESRQIAALYRAHSDLSDWLQPFTSPLPGVAGGRNFGHRRFFNGQARNPHSGADLRAAAGTPDICSQRRANRTGRGAVLSAGMRYSLIMVLVSSASTCIYQQIGVAVGERVERGQQIGLAGATGRVTGRTSALGNSRLGRTSRSIYTARNGGKPGKLTDMAAIGRNDPCHCGSGKKYKHCCLNAGSEVEAQQSTAVRRHRHCADWRRTRPADES